MVDRTGQEVKSTPSKGAIGCLASGDTEEKMASTQDFQVRKISSYFDSEMLPRWWHPSLMNMMPFLGSKASKTLPRPEPFAAFRAPTGVLTSWSSIARAKPNWFSGFLGGADASDVLIFHDISGRQSFGWINFAHFSKRFFFVKIVFFTSKKLREVFAHDD